MSIIIAIIKAIASINKDKISDQKRIDEDNELADAIRNGDGSTVGKIRERRKKYKNFILIPFIVLVLGVTGCATKNDIVLTEGTLPYQLPVGEYYDTKGNLHVEKNNRWSISEEDLFHDTQNIEKKIRYFQKEDIPIYILGGIIALLLVINTIKKDK